jgi:hypothetical protein
MITGQIILNHITDDDIVAILEIKKRHPELVTFNPTALRVVGQQPGNPGLPLYDGAVFGWASEEGLKVVKEILHRLTEPRQ